MDIGHHEVTPLCFATGRHRKHTPPRHSNPGPGLRQGTHVPFGQAALGDNKKYHMDFIAGLANLRARNYRIWPEANKLKAKVLSGRLIPLISSSEALAAGFVCLELYKVLVGGHRRSDYCDSYANLVHPAFGVHKPRPPDIIEYQDISWMVWNSWDFNEDLTLGELLLWLSEKHIHLYGFMFNGIVVYQSENFIHGGAVRCEGGGHG